MEFEYKRVNVNSDHTAQSLVCMYERISMLIDLPTTAFLMYLSADKGASPNTVINHADSLKHFLNSVYAKTSIRSWDKIQRKEMDDYLSNRANDLERDSFKVVVQRIRRFYDWAYAYGWLEKKTILRWDVDYEVRKIQKQKMLETSRSATSDPFNLQHQYIPPSDFEYLLSFNPRKTTFLRERDEIILRLGYECGCRRSETVDPINFSLPRIKKAIKQAEAAGQKGFELPIIGKGKEGGKVRRIYIPQKLKHQIVSFMNGPLKRIAPNSDLLICKVVNCKALPLNEKHATSLFDETMSNMLANGELGRIQDWMINQKARRFHSLRHSYATNYAQILRLSGESTKALQYRMGHKYSTTTDIYIHFEALMAGDYSRAKEYDTSDSNAHIEFGHDDY